MIAGLLCYSKSRRQAVVCLQDSESIHESEPMAIFINEDGNTVRLNWRQFYETLLVVGFNEDLAAYGFSSAMRARADYAAERFVAPLALAATYGNAALAGVLADDPQSVATTADETFLAWLRTEDLEIHSHEGRIYMTPAPRTAPPVELTRDMIDRLSWEGHIERVFPEGVAELDYVWRLATPDSGRIRFPI